ncbi:sialate O-acetylesterase [Planctomycetales bacterium ZRK34]|nr:sialate O-acetylesterase [Planctomycetales bacterium ZRK34]
MIPRQLLLSACVLILLSGSVRAEDSAPVKVFILAGQSNMVGHAKLALLDTQIADPATHDEFAFLKPAGQWITRDDVFIRYGDKHGPLTVGYGARGCNGPELLFGLTVGDHYQTPVLLIKTAWGGRSLFRDFRPPSRGLPPDAVLKDQLARAQKKHPDTTLDDITQAYGKDYRQMLAEIDDTLKNLDTLFPALAGRKVQLAGFVWFQGWNDMISPQYTAEYTDNMIAFIHDVRKDLNAPKLPFVIGQMGVGGIKPDPHPKHVAFKNAQSAAADFPEFKNNVALVKTDQYWDTEAQKVFDKGWKQHLDEWNKVGSNFPYHYLGSHRCYNAMGKAFAEAIIKLNK